MIRVELSPIVQLRSAVWRDYKGVPMLYMADWIECKGCRHSTQSGYLECQRYNVNTQKFIAFVPQS